MCAEFEFSEAQRDPESGIKESLCYVTVGTGIGIGLIINGKCVHGMMHPEGGHVRVPVDEREKTLYNDFKGVCPFHNGCVEGLCSNIAVKERLQLTSVHEVAELADDNEVWDLLAGYLGTFASNLYLTLSYEKILFGGGIFNRAILLQKTREVFAERINSYVKLDKITGTEALEKLIVRPHFGDDLGMIAAAAVGAGRSFTSYEL